VKRFTLADLLLAVAIVAMTAYLVRIGLNLHQRGFEGSEIAIVVGTMAILAVVGCWAAIALCRRLRKRRTESPVR
jgi:ABC-type transport system involved in cytochrome c biogenesis permease component